jgi:hypothetical protein
VAVDDAVVHGTPGDDRLRDGDLVSIDGGAVLDCRVGDAAVSSTVGLARPEDERLIRTAEGRSTRAPPPSSATAWATRPSLHREPCASRGPAADPHGGGALDAGTAAVIGNRVGDAAVTPP